MHFRSPALPRAFSRLFYEGVVAQKWLPALVLVSNPIMSVDEMKEAAKNIIGHGEKDVAHPTCSTKTSMQRTISQEASCCQRSPGRRARPRSRTSGAWGLRESPHSGVLGRHRRLPYLCEVGRH